MKAISKREHALRSEGEELPGRGSKSHRDRLKRRTSKVRRADGKKAAKVDSRQ
jgi:hypothetical protein